MAGRQRIYLSGPMTGLPESNYPAFEKAAQALRDKGYAVLNPAGLGKAVPVDVTPSYGWYLRQAVRMLCEADAVALLPDWDSSRGALVEFQFALACGMDVRLISSWLSDDITPVVMEPTC